LRNLYVSDTLGYAIPAVILHRYISFGEMDGTGNVNVVPDPREWSSCLEQGTVVVELEHLKIETRLTNEKFPSVKGECEIWIR
jgi:hypothetical protein